MKNCNCGKEYSEQSFTTQKVYYCTDCEIYELVDIDCEHDTMPMKIEVANGNIQVRLFCNKCLKLLPGAKKKADYDLSKLHSSTIERWHEYNSKNNSNERKDILALVSGMTEKHLAERGIKYNDYLLSDSWKSLRLRVLQRDNYECQICFETAKEVHHLTYAHFTNEYLFELVSLCTECHKVQYHS